MEALICRNLDAALRNEPKPYMFDATAGEGVAAGRSRLTRVCMHVRDICCAHMRSSRQACGMCNIRCTLSVLCNIQLLNN